MNRPILRFAVLIILSVFIFISCKKSNSLHTYPDNYRVLSFNKTTTGLGLGAGIFTLANPLIENYRFVYDNYNRVSQIYYTSNQPTTSNLASYLTYSNDTIFDTTRLMNYAQVEVDTFITDLRGFITTTYIPGGPIGYSYLGNLLTRITYNDSTYNLFSSYYGNFTKLMPSLSSFHPVVYSYYQSLANRAGDYFQIDAFARYGFNFYQNSSLIKTIQEVNQTTNLTYVMDADSKITQTTATIVDTAVLYPLTTTKVYDIQYEKYK